MIRKTSDQTQAMQRVKVGMTGLAMVLLLIGLASAVFSSASRETPVAVVGAAKPESVANLTMDNATGADDASKEPLAELGVTPSAATESLNTTAAITAPAARVKK